MAKLSPEQLKRGVITSSAGNHAQGVALAASRLGCKATICMPTSTPEIKIANVRRLGGIVELVGDSYQETQAYAMGRAVEAGLTFVHPFDDPYTIAGQGTIGSEIWRQLSDPEQLDAIFVAIGGGGLAAGIASYIKALRPEVRENTTQQQQQQQQQRFRAAAVGRGGKLSPADQSERVAPLAAPNESCW